MSPKNCTKDGNHYKVIFLDKFEINMVIQMCAHGNVVGRRVLTILAHASIER